MSKRIPTRNACRGRGAGKAARPQPKQVVPRSRKTQKATDQFQQIDGAEAMYFKKA